MSSWKPSPLAIAGTAAAGLVAYAVYFDYKRRNDMEFRRKLRKDKKRVDKVVAKSSEAEKAEAEAAAKISPEVLREALEQIRKEEGPKTAEERETYFMSQVGMGEQIALQGPEFYMSAALCFYRALRMYPAPVELIMIYQRTVPPPIFNIIMEMTQLDVSNPLTGSGIVPPSVSASLGDDVDDASPTRSNGSGAPSEASSQGWDKVTDSGAQTPASSQEWDQTHARAEGYYDHFPPKSMNVSVKPQTSPNADGKQIAHKILVVEKDVAKGDVIYTENAIVAALDFDLLGKDLYCSHCLRELTPGTSLSGAFESSFCSTDCQHKAAAQYSNLLFTLSDPLPEAILKTQPNLPSKDKRQEAQEKFMTHLKEFGRAAPLLVAKFIGRQFAVETNKLLPSEEREQATSEDLPESEEYNLNDHMERYRYLEVVPPEGEGEMLSNVLKTALPELEQFSMDERHVTLLGKMYYNCFGVYYGTGRDGKPAPEERPEDVERTRISYGTARQIGTGFYAVSSYLTHSCEPTVQPTFPNGNSELHLIASQDLKKGDQLTVAFVDVTQAEHESVTDCRRRRRMELARGWRFACECGRCAKELALIGETQAEVVMPAGGGSKIEESVERYENKDASTTDDSAL